MNGMTAAGIGNMFGNMGGNASAGYLNDVVSGRYLSAENPYLQQLTNSIKSQVMPSINAQFSNAGMTGSTLHQGSLARGMSDALAAPLFSQYNAERALQQQAAGALPGITDQIAKNQIAAGQAAEGYQQKSLDAEMAAFNEAQQKKIAALQAGTGILGTIGGMGGTASNSGATPSSGGGTTNGTTTNEQTPGLGQALLGGAMALGGIASGMGGLGGLGGLGGMFGGMGNNLMYGNNGLPWAANPNPTYR